MGIGTVCLLANPDIFPLHSHTASNVNLDNLKNLGVKLALESGMGTRRLEKLLQ